MPPKTNSKAEAGNAKKALVKQAKNDKKAASDEASEAADWATGSNSRGSGRADEAAAKADEAARKKREKEALINAEEDGLSSIVKLKTGGGAVKKNVKKKTDDFSLLEAGLTSAADKAAKNKKKAEKDKKDKAFRDAEDAGEKSAAARAAKSLTGNGIVDVNDMLGDNGDIVSNVNKLNPVVNEEEDSLYDISGGMGGLKMKGDNPLEDSHPEKKLKAAHKAFEEKMIKEMREDHPGLKLSQMKEKIFEIWKKSPENPVNAAILAHAAAANKATGA